MSRVSKCSPGRPSSTTPQPRARCRWDLRMKASNYRVLAIATAKLLVAACGKSDAPEAARPTPVRIATASQGPAVPPIDTNGVVVTKHEMRLSFKMGGLVRRIYVQPGEAVKKGQRLAEIELTEVGAQVEQAH